MRWKWVVLAMSLVLVVSCKERRVEPAASTATAASSVRPLAPTDPPLRVEQRQANGHAYRIFVPMASSFQLTLERPAESDEGTVLCVAGTYTSPENEVEGVVVIDGRVVQKKRQKWEGLLRVQDGVARVEHSDEASFEAATLAGYEKSRTSFVQGHLLVDAGKPTKLKQSPALHRRAIATGTSGWGRHRSFVVESLEPVELGSFAADLADIGANAAMNLDMGAWDEGWYRDAKGGVVRLGHDRSSTQRQSNWLVLRD